MRQWEILLEREIISLFNPHSYSRLDWKMRFKLPTLENLVEHGFFASAMVDPRTDLAHVERNRQYLSIVER
ncbi:MAG: hypothetical protein Q8N13_22575 [Acidovorax sp.]|nr:hypothetical protein [Acidovorax sp.]